jgi:hypothetical protein
MWGHYITWAASQINDIVLTATVLSSTACMHFANYQSFRTTLRPLKFMGESSYWRSAHKLTVRKKACRFSMNLRHVLKQHRIMFHYTNPPSSIIAINLVRPIYESLEARLHEAAQMLYMTSHRSWATLTEQVQHDFLRLDQQWTNYMLDRQRALPEEYFIATGKLESAREHIQLLITARSCSRMENCRIDLKLLFKLANVTRTANECLQSSFHFQVDSHPGSDRP